MNLKFWATNMKLTCPFIHEFKSHHYAVNPTFKTQRLCKSSNKIYKCLFSILCFSFIHSFKQSFFYSLMQALKIQSRHDLRWKKRQMHTKFWSKNLKWRDCCGNTGMVGRVKLKFNSFWRCWIQVAPPWQDFVNKVTNIWVP